jgi:pimeloyl-ACP methyl ester carboxylesterase
MERTRVEANGLTFECLVEGDGDRLALCLHGFPDDAGSMAPLQERLADAGFTAVAPYMRGYGPTDAAPGGNYSAGALAADAVALAETLCEEYACDDPVLVGHDWGAVAAYAAALRSPDTFDRMVTMAVPPKFEALLRRHPKQVLRSWYMWFFQLPDVPERALRWDDFSLVEFLWGVWSPSWDYPEERIGSVKETLATGDTVENALAYYRQIVGAGLRSMVSLDQPEVDDEPHVAVPTLVLAGQEDACIGPELFADVEGAFADGVERRVATVPRAGHFLHQERPDVVGEQVVEFLAD